MTGVERDRVRNRLLGRLPPEAFEQIAPHLKSMRIEVQQPLVEAGRPIEAVYFLESGLASVVTVSPDGMSLEVGQVGYEGVTGYPVLLGTDRTQNDITMKVSGEAFQLSADHFLSLTSDAETRLLFLRYTYTRELQLASSALAAGRYNLYQRLARWLLMCHDRLIGDDLPLTHAYLSLLLGVRRSGVTEQLHILEGMHAIRSTRGNIRVLSREILLEIAGGSYGVPEAEYERLIGAERM